MCFIPDIEFPIGEDSYERDFVKMVHLGFTSIIVEKQQQHLSILGVQEFRCLWPVHDEPFRDDSNDDCEEALHDENPPPPSV